MSVKRIILLIVVLLLIIVVASLYFFSNSKAGSKKNQVEESKEVQQARTKVINSDPLLVIVDKQHCLPVNYVPQDLVNVSENNIPTSSESFMLRKIVIQDMNEMIGDAKKNGVNLIAISAYRSYQDQVKTYNYWVKQLGQQQADKQSAPPGCSQHQLGTAVDFNELSLSFANSPAGVWLSQNGWKYGWVISYPSNSEKLTGYSYEPWHYRYIGKENAQNMKKSGLVLSEFLSTNN